MIQAIYISDWDTVHERLVGKHQEKVNRHVQMFEGKYEVEIYPPSQLYDTQQQRMNMTTLICIEDKEEEKEEGNQS